MRRGLAWLGAAAMAFAGCGERHAGTEVGNPITVSADVAVQDYGSHMFTALYFRVMGMGYAIEHAAGAPDSGKCWSRPGGTLVDFAAADRYALPDTVIREDGAWPHAEIILRTPDGPAAIPDSGDIEAWSHPRYAKFHQILAGAWRAVVFEMPAGAEYRLSFGLEATESWRSGDTITVPIYFDALDWTDTLAAFRGLKTRMDGKGVAYMLLSPAENVPAWNALKEALPGAFYADSVAVR